jgi:hypothetical protein
VMVGLAITSLENVSMFSELFECLEAAIVCTDDVISGEEIFIYYISCKIIIIKVVSVIYFFH